jgi:hypothetical protein
MNSASSQPSSYLTITLKPCHPERSLAKSEANRPTESKDPVRPDSCTCHARNFRIVIRFFDGDEAEHLPVSSREVAAWENPARCRKSHEIETESRRDGTKAR